MKRIAVFLLSSLFALPLFASIKVSSLSGPVSVQHDKQWVEAGKGMTLSKNDRIKTQKDGKATLLVDDTSRVWISGGSEMEISSIEGGSFFNLVLGKIKAKVKLLGGKKFRVQTPVSVASVRGTEFSVSSDGQLIVFEGVVDFSDILQLIHFDVGPGQTGLIDALGKAGAPRDLTPEEREREQGQWGGFDEGGQEQQQGGTQQHGSSNELRGELRQVVYGLRNDLGEVRTITSEIKETDLSEGRTLRDVHGNLVRVEQHLLRPDDQTLQLLNLTQRSEGYNYKGTWKDQFTVSHANRLDVLDIRIRMNMDMPAQLSAWPGFVTSHDDQLHPERVNVLMTNQQDSIESVGTWKLKGDLDENRQPLTEDKLVFKNYINGWTVKPGGTGEEQHYPNNGQEISQLYGWSISPVYTLSKDGEADRQVRIYTEGYLINNSGGILTVGDFTSSSTDPFTMLKNSAGEQIIFCRNIDGSSFFNAGNLDLVYIPDIAIAVAQKLGTKIGDLMETGD